MSIYPDWIELDMGTGVTTVVDLLEVEMVSDIIEIEIEAPIGVEIVDTAIEMEVI